MKVFSLSIKIWFAGLMLLVFSCEASPATVSTATVVSFDQGATLMGTVEVPVRIGMCPYDELPPDDGFCLRRATNERLASPLGDLGQSCEQTFLSALAAVAENVAFKPAKQLQPNNFRNSVNLTSEFKSVANADGSGLEKAFEVAVVDDTGVKHSVQVVGSYARVLTQSPSCLQEKVAQKLHTGNLFFRTYLSNHWGREDPLTHVVKMIAWAKQADSPSARCGRFATVASAEFWQDQAREVVLPWRNALSKR